MGVTPLEVKRELTPQEDITRYCDNSQKL